MDRQQGALSDAQLDELLEAFTDLKARYTQVRRHTRKATRLTALEKEIDTLTIRLEDIEQELRAIPATESRLGVLIAAGTVRLNSTRKAFFDAIRVACCNIFLAAMDLFRELYDNRRDDHVLLRSLTRAPGFLFERNGVIHIQLVPELTVQPKVRTALQEFCRRVTDRINQTWSGRASSVLITLTERPPRHLHWPNAP